MHWHLFNLPDDRIIGGVEKKFRLFVCLSISSAVAFVVVAGERIQSWT